MQLADLNKNTDYSYADYFRWDFDERVELINGKVYEMSPAPNRRHQDITGDIYLSLRSFLKSKDSKVYTAPFDVRLPEKSTDDKAIFTVLQPDVCVICDASKLDDRGCIGAPEIIVEVLSPGNNSKELKKKYEVYEQAGVAEYWLVSPQNQWVQVHTLVAGKFIPSPFYSAGDVVSSAVVPGFTLCLDELFKDAG